MGVWIETSVLQVNPVTSTASHPSWVCGLKLLGNAKRTGVWGVTPFVGVWIELGYLLVTPCPNRDTCINLCLGIDVSGYGVLFYVPILTHLFESFGSFRVK